METFQIDAIDQSLGRLASRIATMLRGKHKATYEPRITPQIIVEVTNINKIKFTGLKLEQKTYHHYSGYPGGMKNRNLGELWKKNPKEVIRHTVYRMLPDNRTRDVIIKNLKFK
ncbi:MAG: 50S ribosomal protein L13 [Patescibacteria group bacterium]